MRVFLVVRVFGGCEGVRPAAVGCDDFVDFGHQANGFGQGDDDFVVVGNIFVGQGAGTLALAGLAISFPIQMLMLAALMGVGIGSASVISRALGAKDQRLAERMWREWGQIGAGEGFLDGFADGVSIFVSFAVEASNLEQAVDCFYLRRGE